MSDVRYKYVGPDHLLGVPARDLSDEDVAKLEAGPLADLKGSKIYKLVDTDVTGRVDSDVIFPSVPVPPADEPVGQNEPGFAKSDNVPGGDQQIG